MVDWTIQIDNLEASTVEMSAAVVRAAGTLEPVPWQQQDLSLFIENQETSEAEASSTVDDSSVVTSTSEINQPSMFLEDSVETVETFARVTDPIPPIVSYGPGGTRGGEPFEGVNPSLEGSGEGFLDFEDAASEAEGEGLVLIPEVDVTQAVQDILQTSQLGSDPSLGNPWPLYCVNEPTDPDDCITIFDTAPVLQGRDMNTGSYFERPGFMIRVRSAKYTTGYDKAKEIADYLDSLKDAPLLSTAIYTVHAVSRVSGPIPLGQEVGDRMSKRYLFSINGTASLSTVSS